jgi:glycosyltransferase involved in cell wall biosynthesis
MAKILITNNHLANMGGTETWVMTMVKELAKEHQVGVFTQVKGYVSDLLKEYIDDKPRDYDLALINHNTCQDVQAKFKIFTTHGTVPELEKPPTGMDYYVAVSENTSKHHNVPHIIKNPIDTEKFRPIKPIGFHAQSVLTIADKDIGIKGIRPSRHKDNMPELINQSDLVVSMGRGVLEAMSCGRPVIVWDDRPYWGARGDGYLDDLDKLTGNVAGEYNLKKIDWQAELAKYRPEHGQRNRKYILDNHDVRKIAKEYLEIWQTNIK